MDKIQEHTWLSQRDLRARKANLPRSAVHRLKKWPQFFKDFDLIPNLIYTFANCRLPSYSRKKIRVKNEFKDEALKFVN